MAELADGKGGSEEEVREYLHLVANSYTNGNIYTDMGYLLEKVNFGESFKSSYTSSGTGSGILETGTRRVLVLGDSYTLGWGLQRLDERWANRIARVLGTNYTVDTVAMPGASLYSYANWAERIMQGEEVIKGPYDLVIIGLSENDLTPGILEMAAKPAKWNRDLPKYVYPEDMGEEQWRLVEYGEARNPNAEHIQAAGEAVAEIAPVRIVAPLFGVDQRYWPAMSEAVQTLEQSGWMVAQMSASTAAIKNLKPRELVVAPFDTHPNEKLNSQYATDIERTLENILRGGLSPDSRVGEGGVGIVNPPAEVTYQTGGVIQINFDTETMPAKCVPVEHPRGRHHCDLDERYEIEERIGEIQQAPCLKLSTPHSIISLPAGAGRIENLGGSKLRVWEATADGVWRQGRTWTGDTEIQENTRYIAIGDLSNRGCQMGEPIVAPSYQIQIYPR